MLNVVGITSDDIDIYIPILKVLLDASIKKSNALLTVDSIIKAIKDRDMQLWIVKEDEKISAVCVTEILITPLCRILGIVALAGGNHKQWKDLLEQTLTDYAKEKACKYIEIQGRRGWNRILNNFKQISVVLRKEV